MATCNLNQCLRALEAQNLQAELVTGKNPKQVLKVIFADGRAFKTGTTYTQAEFEELFQLSNDTSMARSKVEQAHAHARCQENICDDITRMQNWQDQNATYTKKSSYNYARLAYPELMQKVFDDYAVSMHDYCVVKNENTFIKDNLIIPIETLRQFTKLWLSENKCFDKYQNKIDFAIKTYASKTNWILA